MQQYHAICERVLKTGIIKKDRTGVGNIFPIGYNPHPAIKASMAVRVKLLD
jgi:thymidylate synthase